MALVVHEAAGNQPFPARQETMVHTVDDGLIDVGGALAGCDNRRRGQPAARKASSSWRW